MTNEMDFGIMFMGDLNESPAVFLLLLQKVCRP